MKNDRQPTSHHSTAPTRPSALFVGGSWIAVGAIAILIFYMSAHTGNELDTSSGIITIIRSWLEQLALSVFGHPVDISPVGHFGEYFFLGLTLANALRLHVPLRRSCVYALMLASAYGITDEIHQIFVPQRSCDPLDWIVDTVAAGLACLILYAIMRHKQSKRGSNL